MTQTLPKKKEIQGEIWNEPGKMCYIWLEQNLTPG